MYTDVVSISHGFTGCLDKAEGVGQLLGVGTLRKEMIAENKGA